MEDPMFKHLPDMLKVYLDPSLHENLRECGKALNFEELRKLTKDWVDELEKRFG